MSNEEIIRAFHLMWDNFPEAVMITQKSREIIAVNKKAAEFGLKPGVKCSTIGAPENHAGCQCNAAVDTGAAQFVTYDGKFGKAYGYWIPIPEKPEWIIHFGVGYAFEYKKINRAPAKKSASIHGLTKDTALEPTIAAMAAGEANGVMMYYALARLASEQGLDDAAATFIEAANQEAIHAGFYATLNGKYPQNFWQLVAGIRTAELKGEASVKALADKVREAGLTVAADEMEIFAKQEGHHGVILGELLDKYAPETSAPSAQKVFVCKVCGYEHTGDVAPDKCPLCGQPASSFKEKSAIKISAVKLYDGGFMMKSFACGGGLPQGSIAEVKLRSSLQNYVIDTGDEIILVDTGMPAETEIPVTEKSVITFGDKLNNYVDALKAAGYAPEKVSKILVTHKHPDHTGELRAFPNAKIFISRIEADDMNLTGDNVVRVDFTDGAYKNFDACQKIADGVYYIFAPGHTKGNSLVIVDAGDKFFMIHGDVTYTDEALLENKLSVVFEDLPAARDTLNKVRAFIKENKTVYLSTHTPLGCENLAAQKIMTLPDVEEAPVEDTEADAPKEVGGTVWVCSVCGYEHVGDEPPEFCPRCKQPKTAFRKK